MATCLEDTPDTPYRKFAILIRDSCVMPWWHDLDEMNSDEVANAIAQWIVHEGRFPIREAMYPHLEPEKPGPQLIRELWDWLKWAKRNNPEQALALGHVQDKITELQEKLSS